MKNRYVISSCAGLFPGASSPDDLWNKVVSASLSPPESLQSMWGVKKEKYFAAMPGIAGKTYLDLGHVINEPVNLTAHRDFGLAMEGRQLALGNLLLKDFLGPLTVVGSLPPPTRVGLILGTSWTDASYFVDDLCATFLKEQSIPRGLDPTKQCYLLAKKAGICGPTLAVDTACASSLYALALAIDHLELGVADAMVVMGLNAFLPHFLYVGFAKIQALATRGVCLPFSVDACGIIPGEAVAALLLETEESALRFGRTPLATITAVALSSDGGERSLFAPGFAGQKLAYARAYAQVDANEVDYIEAHGTGTPLGDATEVASLNEFFSSRGRATRSLPLGSVKSLIGHTLAAAGAVSLIKATKILQHKVIPCHINVTPLPQLADSCLYLPTHTSSWPDSSRPMRVGVTSLGFGGANAHVVLEEWKREVRRFSSAAVSNENIKSSQGAGSPRKQRVALVAAEGCFAKFANLAAAASALAVPPVKGALLPPDRGHGLLNSPEGFFLEGAMRFDANSVRMGPAQAKKLDPFALLVAELCSQVLGQLPPKISKDDIGLVVCTDLGAVTAQRLSRKISLDFAQWISEEEKNLLRKTMQIPELSVESITGSLPSMLSALPAAAKKLRAFHLTCSASPLLFWQSLALVPQWFTAGRCKALLLAAGSQWKGFADNSELLKGNNPLGEGAAALALCEESLLNGERPLAWLEQVISRPLQDTAEAAKLLCVSQNNVHFYKVEFSENLGVTAIHTDYFGHLREAAGIQILPSLVSLSAGCHVVISFFLQEGSGFSIVLQRDGGQRWNSVFPINQKSASVVEVSFGNKAVPLTPACDNHNTPLLELWHETSSAALESFWNSRARVAWWADLGAGRTTEKHATQFTNLPLIKRRAENCVVENFVKRDQKLECDLVVDEGHSYFFDHPLDHVPGILILEAVTQVVEAYYDKATYIFELDIIFKRWVEKNKTTKIVLQPLDSELLGKQASRVTAQQGGKECCVVNVRVAQWNLSSSQEWTMAQRTSAMISAPMGRPDPKMLHKHRPENVLVGVLQQVTDREFQVTTLPIENGHFFEDGNTAWHSPNYLLEIGRQFMMQIVHGKLGVPLGVPMNLLKTSLSLENPIPRSAVILLKNVHRKLIDTVDSQLAEFYLDIMANGIFAGRIVIKAQATSKKFYEKLRNKF